MFAELQTMLLRMVPHAGHVLVVGRGDGAVMILGTSNAHQRLPMIVGASPLEHQVEYVETEHYRAIETDMLTRFRRSGSDAYGHWVHADMKTVLEALDEYDPKTGARQRCRGLELGQRVYVAKLGKGEVIGFKTTFNHSSIQLTDRVVVLIQGIGYIAAPRDSVKPLVRLAA